MASITLSTLRTRIRQLGDFVNSSVFTDAFLTDRVNEAIGQYCDMLDETWEGYRDTTGTVSTVAGTATVAVPSGFLKARAVDILDGGKWRPLDLYAISQTYRWTDTGVPMGYMHVGANLELFPTPDAVYSIRLRYIPEASKLSADGDSVDFPNGWEAWVIYAVLAMLDEREERNNAPRLAMCDRIRARVAAAAKTRNVAGPRYVPFPGEGGGEWLP